MKTRLRDLREDHDLTQREVGAQIFCSQKVYSNYERELRDMPTAYFVSLADFYGVSVDYLLRRTNVEKPYP